MKRIGYIIAALAATVLFAVIGCTQAVAPEHTHSYENGACSVCGTVCKHDKYVKGVCAECGKACGHDGYTDGACSTCGAKCAHTYVSGVCSVCGTVCGHDKYVNGACAVCGSAHAEHAYSNGVCSVCGFACLHETYANNVCTACGKKEPASVHYDYMPHVSETLPRISINTVDDSGATGLMYTGSMGFNMYDYNSKNNRPYYNCTVSVGNCDGGYVLNDIVAQVKIRGNYTANYAKKPFRIKFEKKQGMLGLNDGAKLKNWVLLADYKDISMTRNTLAFYLGNMIFESDGYYCTDYRPVELYLNGEYWGMYLLAEHQQVNADRVNVSVPEDNYTGTDIGYMLEYDGYYNFEAETERFACNYNGHATLKTRSGADVRPNQDGFTIKNDIYDMAQTNFIKTYINNLYKLCYKAVYNHEYYKFNASNTELEAYTPVTDNPVRETVERVVDIRSLADAFIINELACDADIAWSSFCMSVDFGASGDKLLRFQAPWDFDSAFGLKDSCASGKGLFAANSSNPWLVVFVNESWFWNEIKAKWKEMHDAGVMNKALEAINGGRSRYADDYEKNFGKWGFVIDHELNAQAKQLKNHAEAVQHLYNWFNTRVDYLNTQWL